MNEKQASEACVYGNELRHSRIFYYGEGMGAEKDLPEASGHNLFIARRGRMSGKNRPSAERAMRYDFGQV